MALSLFFSQARSFVNIRKLHFNIVFQVLRGCFRIFRGCSGNLFRVLWGVPRCSGYVACFTDTRRTFHSNSGVIIHVMSSPKNFFFYIILPSVLGKDCSDIKRRGGSHGDGMYWLDPDGGSHSNAFLAYCDMTSYDGGWTMCYTTDEYANPKTEVTYDPQFPYKSDGYRTNCNNISVS